MLTPDGSLLATISYDKTARVWDLETGVVLRMLPHARALTHIALAPDGRLVACAQDDGSVVVWELLRGVAHTLPACAGPLSALAFSADGARLLTASKDSVHVWDAAAGVREALFVSDAPVTCAMFDGATPPTTVLAGTDGGTLHFLSIL